MSKLVIYTLLFAAPLFGGLLSYFLFDKIRQSLKWVLSFSGAYLFSVTVLHLIPEAFSGHNDTTLGLYVLLGFFIQLILEQFSKGVEHGHIHTDDSLSKGYIFSIMIGLSLHSFLEGLPLGGHFHHEHAQMPFLYSVALHKIPAAFALVAIMNYAHLSKSTILLLLALFCSISPFGALTSEMIAHSGANFEKYHAAITALVIGSFFHVSTTILFETGTKSHKFSSQKIFAIIAGVALALLTANI